MGENWTTVTVYMWASVDIIKFFKPTTEEDFDYRLLTILYEWSKGNLQSVLSTQDCNTWMIALNKMNEEMNEMNKEMNESGNAFTHRLIILQLYWYFLCKINLLNINTNLFSIEKI